MPTLQELTLAHSQRLSEIYRSRDVRLTEARASRDLRLRAIAAAAKAFQKYDEELVSSREKQLAADAKAEAARASMLAAAADRRADALEDAQLTRRSIDVEAVGARRRAEDAAAAKYLAALNAARELNDTQRGRALQEAERTRRLELDQARRAHDQALSESQQKYRAAVDAAIIGERRDGRDGERGYFDAIRFGDAAVKAAHAAAENALHAALANVDEARDVLRAWREQVSAIKAEPAKAENEEFSRFRRELEALKT